MVIRITTTTICGTDVHIVRGEYPVCPGLIIGHEPVGVVAELGAGVTGYEIGDRVLVGAITPCGQCHACLSGHQAQCGHGHDCQALGGWRFGNTIHGAQAEYLLVPSAQANLAKIPDELTDEQVVLLSDIASTGISGAEAGGMELRSLLQQSLTACKALFDHLHDGPEIRRLMAYMFMGMADVALACGEKAFAIRNFETSRGLLEELTAADPDSLQARSDLCVAHQRLGRLALESHQLAEAREHYRRCVEFGEVAAAADPESALARSDLANGLGQLGLVETLDGDHVSARALLERSLDLMIALETADPENAEVGEEIVTALGRLMELTAHKGARAAALTYASAVRLRVQRGQVASAEARARFLQRVDAIENPTRRWPIVLIALAILVWLVLG